MESLKSTITNIIPEFAGTIVEHVGYPFKVDNNLKNLEKMTRGLVAMKEDVKTTIKSAERENGAPTRQILEWLRKAESFEKEAEEIQENNRKRRRSVWSDYKSSKSAAKKVCEAKSLFDQKFTIKVTVRLQPSLTPEIPASSSKAPNLESALFYINNDVHNIIGIWGMGGVGKTHLLKQINNELSRDVNFNVVIFVTCSKECSEEKIQNEIIGKLGLDKPNSIEQKQWTIFNYLKQKSFVLLLDDLWSRVDLQIVGIPPLDEVVDSYKRKVVLTTRSKNVCELMEVYEPMRVNCLEWNVAWTLFKGKANEKIIESNPLVQKYALEVFKQLGRLPLALVTIGRALSQTFDPSEWKHAAELLKEARIYDVEHSETDETMFKRLKFSYDRLRNDNLRECFLLCSLYPEDSLISRWTLLHLWVGLGLIDEDDIQMVYNVGNKYIKELQAACLLEETERESHVKLHDVIRDMSLWIVSKQGTEKNKWIIMPHIAANDFKEIVIHEETELISLHNLEGKSFFSRTHCGAEITFLSIRWVRFPPPLLHFSKLTGLELIGTQFTFVPIEICNIITLHFLDLSYNKIKSLPAELGALINLRYLMLRGNMINTVPAGTISKMRALQVLDLRPHYKWTRFDGELAFVPILLNELQNLPAIGAIGIEIDDEVHLRNPGALLNVPLSWLSVSIRKKLSTFYFSPCFLETSQSRSKVVSLGIQHMVLERLIFQYPCDYPSSCQLESLGKLYISHVTVKEILWKGIEPKTLSPMLKCVKLWECKELTSISWVVHLPSLQELYLTACSSIKQLVIGSEVNVHTFPCLKLLYSSELPKLESICDPKIAFPALEFLQIRDCCKLKKLPFRTENIPPKLKSIVSIPEDWWKNIEWEDNNVESSLSRFVRFNF